MGIGYVPLRSTGTKISRATRLASGDRDEDVVDFAGELVVTAVGALAADAERLGVGDRQGRRHGDPGPFDPVDTQGETVRGACAFEVVPRPVRDVQPWLGAVDPSMV